MKNSFYIHVETGNNIDEPREITTAAIHFDDNLIWDEDMVKDTRQFISEMYDVNVKAVKTGFESQIEENDVRMMEESMNFQEALEMNAAAGETERKYMKMMEHLRAKKLFLIHAFEEGNVEERANQIHFHLKDYPREMTNEYLEEFNLIREFYARKKNGTTQINIDSLPVKIRSLYYVINEAKMRFDLSRLEEQHKKFLQKAFSEFNDKKD